MSQSVHGPYVQNPIFGSDWLSSIATMGGIDPHGCAPHLGLECVARDEPTAAAPHPMRRASDGIYLPIAFKLALDHHSPNSDRNGLRESGQWSAVDVKRGGVAPVHSASGAACATVSTYPRRRLSVRHRWTSQGAERQGRFLCPVPYCHQGGNREAQSERKKDSFPHASPPIRLAGTVSRPARRERGSVHLYGNSAWRRSQGPGHAAQPDSKKMRGEPNIPPRGNPCLRFLGGKEPRNRGGVHELRVHRFSRVATLLNGFSRYYSSYSSTCDSLPVGRVYRAFANSASVGARSAFAIASLTAASRCWALRTRLLVGNLVTTVSYAALAS